MTILEKQNIEGISFTVLVSKLCLHKCFVHRNPCSFESSKGCTTISRTVKKEVAVCLRQETKEKKYVLTKTLKRPLVRPKILNRLRRQPCFCFSSRLKKRRSNPRLRQLLSQLKDFLSKRKGRELEAKALNSPVLVLFNKKLLFLCGCFLVFGLVVVVCVFFKQTLLLYLVFSPVFGLFIGGWEIVWFVPVLKVCAFDFVPWFFLRVPYVKVRSLEFSLCSKFGFCKVCTSNP